MDATRLPHLIPRCVLDNKPPLQKKTIVLPAVTKNQQRSHQPAWDQEPINMDATGSPHLIPRCALLNKRPGGKKIVLEPIKRKDPLPSLVLSSVEVNKAPLKKRKTTILPQTTKPPQKALHPAVAQQQRVQKQQRKRRCDGQHLTSADALSTFRKHLTLFEQREIQEYEEVWYVGIAAEKLQASGNHGYDDIYGHYQMVIEDHIAYRYEVLEAMGQGSFGRVLKCRDHKTKELVAMKVIVNNPRFAVEAMAEVEILELLQKKDKNDIANIVHMKEHFHFRNHLCITFNLMGNNLFDVMNNREFKGLGTSQVRSHAIPLLQCLQFLSRTNIIHCDLKLENILVSNDDSEVIKVADFGASRLEHQNNYPVTQTLVYMSPEVLLMKAYGKPIDMWSLGCMLAELKTGDALFDADDESELLHEMTKLLGHPPKGMLEKTSLQYALSGQRNSKEKTRWRLSMALDTEEDLFVDFIQRCLEYEPRKRMTPDEAMRHPWIQKDFHWPSSMDDTAHHQPIITETMVDSTSSTAQSTSRPRPRPVGAKGRRRGEGAPWRNPCPGDSF